MSSLRTRQPRLLFLIGLLVLSFVLTTVLAYQAQVAARSHRDIAERTLRDYAAFSAYEYGVYVKDVLSNEVSSMLFVPADFGDNTSTRPRRMPWASDSGEAHAPCTGERVDSGYFYFRVDMATGEMPLMRGCSSEAVRNWIRDTIPSHVRAYMSKSYWDYMGRVVGRVNGEPRLAAFLVQRDESGQAVSAIGFVTPFRSFAKGVFRAVHKNYPLLPPSLVGKTPNDSLISVYVSDTAGRPLYQSAVTYSSNYMGKAKLPAAYGGMIIHTALRPELAEQRLLIGGLPRSRLPLLLSLVAVSAGLVAVSVQQLRREYELGRLRSDFISSISHELRTPLAQVRMFAETLLLGRVRNEEERHRSLEIIDQEARRLTHLVENVLQFSRSERHLTRLSPEPTEIAGQVSDAIEAFAPIAQARKVSVRAELERGIIAPVDRSALRQTLLNLLDNAVKYGPNAQALTVGMTFEHGLVRLWVDDEGPGIEIAQREKIWDPFYRLDRDANSAVAGSGIGLAVVRELVTQHGGRVWVERSKSGGARFVVELPGASRATAADLSTAAHEVSAESSLL